MFQALFYSYSTLESSYILVKMSNASRAVCYPSIDLVNLRKLRVGVTFLDINI